jgi:hypothetical protein
MNRVIVARASLPGVLSRNHQNPGQGCPGYDDTVHVGGSRLEGNRVREDLPTGRLKRDQETSS